MATNKTVETEASVDAYLATVDEKKRADSVALRTLMERASGEPAKMWGAALVGFGRYHYRYDSGREGDFMLTGFAPRKQQFTVHIMPGFEPYQDHLSRLGKHKTARSCLYFTRLANIDVDVLEEIVADSVVRMRKAYPEG